MAAAIPIVASLAAQYGPGIIKSITGGGGGDAPPPTGGVPSDATLQNRAAFATGGDPGFHNTSGFYAPDGRLPYGNAAAFAQGGYMPQPSYGQGVPQSGVGQPMWGAPGGGAPGVMPQMGPGGMPGPYGGQIPMGPAGPMQAPQLTPGVDPKTSRLVPLTQAEFSGMTREQRYAHDRAMGTQNKQDFDARRSAAGDAAYQAFKNDPNYEKFRRIAGDEETEKRAQGVKAQAMDAYNADSYTKDLATEHAARTNSRESAFLNTEVSDGRRGQLDNLTSAAANRNIVDYRNSQFVPDQRAFINRLEDPNQPSAAQAQLQKGTDAAISSQYALAASSPGMGGLAGYNAANNAAHLQQQAGLDSTMLRAQEDQAHNALLSTSLGNFRGQDDSYQQMINQGRIQATGLNDSMMQFGITDSLGLDAADRASKQAYWPTFGDKTAADQATNSAQAERNRAAEAAQRRTDQIMSTPDGLAITLGNEPASIPAPFAELVLDHLERRPNMQTGNRPDTHWLFPSTRPGQHLTPNTVMTRLRAMGIDLQGARNAAIKALVQRVPPPIVASQLGYSPGTTQRHAELAAVPDSRYAALITDRAPT